MSVTEISVGQIVTSTAGRDSGRNYVVIEILPSPFILVADGKKHFMTKPKKKNIRHVKVLKSVAQGGAVILQSSEKFTNEYIRQTLVLLNTPD